jgi:putative transposase
VGIRPGVLHELTKAEVDEVARKGRPIRTAERREHDGGEVALEGTRDPSRAERRPTAPRSVGLQTYAHVAARDQVSDAMLERMLAGLSTRRCASVGQPDRSELKPVAHLTSKSAATSSRARGRPRSSQ